jgi:glycine/D-amino acid oxidase-like deaminating enzyme
VDSLPLEVAAKRYPMIRFDGLKSVWLERRAGALSARRACMAVREAFIDAGGTWRTGLAEPGAVKSNLMSAITLSDGSKLEADRFVFACGPWLGKVFPAAIGESVRPTRQEVHYFGTPSGREDYLPGRLPIWIDFGERIFYGIPDLHGRGFKIADDTRGEEFDPTDGERTPTRSGIERARGLLAERFPALAKAPLVHSEVCQYENSPDGHLILDRHPEAANVWVAGGGSGHGFKLAPAVGELAARAVLSGHAVPKMFGLGRLRDLKKRGTQFDRSS